MDEKNIITVMEKVMQLANHNIPYYAYGESEAACEMAQRLNEIQAIMSLAIEAKLKEKNT